MIIDFRIKPPLRDSESDPRVKVPDEFRQYEGLYGLEANLNIPLAELLSEMAQSDVKGVIQTEPEFGSYRTWNDRTALLVRSHPGRFLAGFAAVNPRDGMDAVRELDRAYHELGLRGLNLVPGFLGMPPTDRLFYPLYTKCIELGIPVTLHTGVNFSAHGPIRHGSPLYVDEIACDFPELVIICNHGGWPWPTESVAVAWKHPNVYLEFGAISPKYLAHPHGGWGPMLHFMNSVLSDQILFGTDWPVIRYARMIEESRQLGLKEPVLESYLYRNAERLLHRIRRIRVA